MSERGGSLLSNAVGLGLAVLAACLVLFPRHLPEEGLARARMLGAAREFGRARAALDRDVVSGSLDPAVHWHYLEALFDRREEVEDRDFDRILEDREERYRLLAGSEPTWDLGHLGLGMLEARRGRPGSAIEHLRAMRDTNSPYRRIELGKLTKSRELLREASHDPDVGPRAALPFLQATPPAEWIDVVRDPVVGPLLPVDERRAIVGASGTPDELLRLNVDLFRRSLEPFPLAMTLLGGILVVVGLRRLDTFEPEKSHHLALASAGGALGLVCLALGSGFLVGLPVGRALGGKGGLLDWILNTGLPEELVKLVPVLLVALVPGIVTEPFDLLLYGAVSALGFSTLEDAVYGSAFGATTATTRLLNPMHIVFTGIPCALWAEEQVMRRNPLAAIVGGLLAASIVHGLYDWGIQLLVPWDNVPLYVYALPVAAGLWFWVAEAKWCLERSPRRPAGAAGMRMIDLQGAILVFVFGSLLLGYVGDHFEYWSGQAFRNLGKSSLWAVFMAVPILLHAGRIRVGEPAGPRGGTRGAQASGLLSGESGALPAEDSQGKREEGGWVMEAAGELIFYGAMGIACGAYLLFRGDPWLEWRGKEATCRVERAWVELADDGRTARTAFGCRLGNTEGGLGLVLTDAVRAPREFQAGDMVDAYFVPPDPRRARLAQKSDPLREHPEILMLLGALALMIGAWLGGRTASREEEP